MVFISLPSLQLCDIAIGSPVVVKTANEIIVQTAWPTNGKSLTSVSLTKHSKYMPFYDFYLFILHKLFYFVDFSY